MDKNVKGMFVGSGIMIAGSTGQFFLKDCLVGFCASVALWLAGAVVFGVHFIRHIKAEKEEN